MMWWVEQGKTVEMIHALTVTGSVKTCPKQEGWCDGEFSRVLGLNLT